MPALDVPVLPTHTELHRGFSSPQNASPSVLTPLSFLPCPGGHGQHEEKVQMPRYLRELPAEDMLAGDA